MTHLQRIASLFAMLAASAGAQCADAAQPLVADSFEGARRLFFGNSDGQALEGWLWRASIPAGTAAPAVVMLHGCSGVYGSNGYGDEDAISSRFVGWARRLNALGMDALLVDSFSRRDPQHTAADARQNYCNDRAAVSAIGAREEVERPRDALAGYDALLALRPSRTDRARVALLGWSHGGSAALATVAAGNLAVQPFVTAQSFYPGCGLYGAFGNPGAGTSSYIATAPLGIFLGLDDPISTLAACGGHRDHSDAAGGAAMTVRTFEQVGHSFDGAECVRDDNGPSVSPWTQLRYSCSGSYDGVPFDVRDWHARRAADHAAMCALLAAFGEPSERCGEQPALP